MNKRIIKFTSILTGITMVIGLLAGSVQLVYGSATNGNNPGGNVESNPPDGSTVFSKSRGASWVRYPVNHNNNITIPAQTVSGQTVLAGGTLRGCDDDGAEYYYRLAYNKYIKGTNTTWVAQQSKGVLSVNSLSVGTGIGAAGTVPFVYEPSVWGEETTIDFNKAYDYFNKTIAAGMNDGVSWENVGMFCWSERLLCQDECSPDDPDCVECPQPEPEPDPRPANARGEFYSTSTVSVNSQADIPAISATSEKDGEALVRISTDAESVVVTFTHHMYYNNEISFGRYDNVSSVPSTTWSITNTLNDRQNSLSNPAPSTNTFSANHSSGSFNDAHGNKVKDIGSLSNSQAEIGTISIAQTIPVSNTPTTICYTNRYSGKYATFSANSGSGSYTSHHGPSGTGLNYDPHGGDRSSGYSFTDYTLTGVAGWEDSEACIEITRPEDPTGTADSNGSTDSPIMFTGEDAPISWDTTAINLAVRRVLDWQAVTWVTPVDPIYDKTKISGSINKAQFNFARQQFNVCDWYRRTRGLEMVAGSCGVINNRSGSTGFTEQNDFETHSYGEQEQIVVPNLVGYKYCNSFGYRYQYFNYTSDGGGQWISGPSYWKIYDAACSTVAKKPSTTIWNGSLMTSGGTKATPAYRFDDVWDRKVTSDGGSRTLYGSWSEFLAVVGQNTQGVASGSNLSIGSKRGGRDICNDSLAASNSTLTIANTSCGELGYSGIQNNSTYVTRLDTYLKSGASNASHYYNVPNTDDLRNKLAAEGISIDGINKTIVVHASGDFNITQNIKTNLGPYNSIYQIPQVIIFADGNVNISSAVTEIDAWIITPNGTVNTCSEFNHGVTEADAVGRRYDICTNQLVFNGPVLAKNLNLRRSFGSDPAINYRVSTFGAPSLKQAAGEIFNLRSDIYLWGYAQAGRYDSSYTESYTRELAPRY